MRKFRLKPILNIDFRTAFKDNSSHYDIDGRKCTFKDVSRLLRKKGVDLDHNRFLILQVYEKPVLLEEKCKLSLFTNV
jgi:hypothetical protein